MTRMLTVRDLNRTMLRRRQHLPEGTSMPALA